jgi:hypothetical protein
VRERKRESEPRNLLQQNDKFGCTEKNLCFIVGNGRFKQAHQLDGSYECGDQNWITYICEN